MPDRLPPLNGLRAFESAARHLSFAKAADELNVTPAALSYQIRNLEDILGVKLFERRNRSILLTEIGQLSVPKVREGFEKLREATAIMKPGRTSNVMVVTCGPAFAAKWLAPRLVHFMERHPDIEIRLAATMSVMDFGQEDIDVAIRFGPGHYPGLHRTILFEEAMTPMCSPELLRGPRPLQTPADLAGHTLIRDESMAQIKGAPGWIEWLSLAGVTGINPLRGPDFSHADHALDAAIGGGGVVLGRRRLAVNDLRTGRLVAPFDIDLSTGLVFSIVCERDRRDDPVIAAFIEWIEEEAASDLVY